MTLNMNTIMHHNLSKIYIAICSIGALCTVFFSTVYAQTPPPASDAISVSAIVTNGITTTTGGGGGGGGSTYIPINAIATGVVFSGYAYPYAKITLLQNGVLVYATTARADATFSMPFSVPTPGIQLFSLSAEDTEAHRSILISIPVTIANNTVTSISHVSFPPTLSLPKNTVAKNTSVILTGQAIPNATISLYQDGVLLVTGMSDEKGQYTITLDTSTLALGAHTLQTRSKTQDGKDSGFGLLVSYTLATSDAVANETSKSADLSGDGIVNLTDFSILAYWFGKPNPPNAVDLNGDGKIDLVDFSILAYQWNE